MRHRQVTGRWRRSAAVRESPGHGLGIGCISSESGAMTSACTLSGVLFPAPRGRIRACRERATTLAKEGVDRVPG